MTAGTSGHLIPYKGRNHSGCTDQNLLWAHDNTYIMDNHRAAAWCWVRHLKLNQQFSILHIDKHYDLLQSRLDAWQASTPPMATLSIERYLELEYNLDGIGMTPVIRWDNYFSIFMKQRESFLQRAYFLTHYEGDKPWFEACEKDFWEAIDNLAYWLDDDAPWIVNVDMDYFFAKQGENQYFQIFSDYFIGRLGTEVHQANRAGRVNCITLALSPEMCGGWEPALHALEVFGHGLSMSLPDL